MIVWAIIVGVLVLGVGAFIAWELLAVFHASGAITFSEIVWRWQGSSVTRRRLVTLAIVLLIAFLLDLASHFAFRTSLTGIAGY